MSDNGEYINIELDNEKALRHSVKKSDLNNYEIKL